MAAGVWACMGAGLKEGSSIIGVSCVLIWWRLQAGSAALLWQQLGLPGAHLQHVCWL